MGLDCEGFCGPHKEWAKGSGGRVGGEAFLRRRTTFDFFRAFLEAVKTLTRNGERLTEGTRGAII